jgi:thiamine-monophosphate kinase
MTEFDFIRRYLKKQQDDAQVVLGIGDDAAIIRPQVGFDLCFSSDMLLKGRHFFADVQPDDLAWKVLAVNISDMAAMGATPRWVLLSVGLPELDESWLHRFCNNLFDLAQRFGVTLIGGDTTRGDLVFNVTIIGELPTGKALRRDTAKEGDDVWISGQIGLAAAGLNHCLGKCVLTERIAEKCKKALLRPMPRVKLGQNLLSIAHAAQDVSDGLAQDIGHILKASAVGAELWVDSLPSLSELKQSLSRQQWLEYTLSGGDDYELVFTAPASCRKAVIMAGKESGTAVTRIGRITDTGRLKIISSGGDEVKLTTQGFDHFG